MMLFIIGYLVTNRSHVRIIYSVQLPSGGFGIMTSRHLAMSIVTRQSETRAAQGLGFRDDWLGDAWLGIKQLPLSPLVTPPDCV